MKIRKNNEERKSGLDNTRQNQDKTIQDKSMARKDKLKSGLDKTT